MSLNIIDNFNYQGKKSNFERDQFKTINDMVSYSYNKLDDGHIAYCIETKNHYKYKESNSVDSVLGKWRLIPEVVILTQEEYDQLESKDENTIYMTYDI